MPKLMMSWWPWWTDFSMWNFLELQRLGDDVVDFSELSMLINASLS